MAEQLLQVLEVGHGFLAVDSGGNVSARGGEGEVVWWAANREFAQSASTRTVLYRLVDVGNLVVDGSELLLSGWVESRSFLPILT